MDKTLKRLHKHDLTLQDVSKKQQHKLNNALHNLSDVMQRYRKHQTVNSIHKKEINDI